MWRWLSETATAAVYLVSKSINSIFGTVSDEQLQPKTETTPNTPPTESYNLHDIYHIVFLLRQKLVPDLMPSILHQAGIFYTQTSHSKSSSVTTNITENTSPSTILTTSCIRSSARLRNPVRKVKFTIESRDQGWATGAGNWTWFTAAVLPNTDGVDEVGVVNPPSTGKERVREREVLRNDRAGRGFMTYVVEWSVDSEDEEEREWVRCLVDGDRIQVRAWAKYAGWVNKVKGVSVEVGMAAIV